MIYYTPDSSYSDDSNLEDIYKIEIEIEDEKEIKKLEKVNVNKSIIVKCYYIFWNPVII